MNKIPKEVQDYFSHGRHYIRLIEIEKPYKLILTYDNDIIKEYDMASFMGKGVFKKLADSGRFDTVFIDEHGCPCWDLDPKVDSSIFWNNRIDISSDNCYIYGVTRVKT